MKQVSEKSTKQEILKAYQDVLADKDNHATGALFENTEKISEKASPNTKRKFPSMADKAMSEDLLLFVEQMENDFKTAMQEFTRGVVSLRTELEKERANHEEQTREQRESLRREQESYIYERDLKRKKEEAEYEMRSAEKERQFAERIASKERDMSEREAIIRSREQEMKELEKTVTTFPTQLEKAVAEATEKATNSARAEAQAEAALINKDILRERDIAKINIQNLEESLKRQMLAVSTLEKQLASANERAQSLALTVIEAGARRNSASEAAEKAAA